MLPEVILSGGVLVCAIQWIKWKVAVHATVLFMKKNGYRLPTDLEMKECTHQAATLLAKSLGRNLNVKT